MDPATEHLADLVFRFTGAGVQPRDFMCSRIKLCEASALMMDVLTPEFSSKRDLDGRVLFAMSNPRYTAQEVEDALKYIHQGVVPASFQQMTAMLGPLEWLQLRRLDPLAREAVRRLGEMPPAEAVLSFEAVVESMMLDGARDLDLVETLLTKYSCALGSSGQQPDLYALGKLLVATHIDDCDAVAESEEAYQLASEVCNLFIELFRKVDIQGWLTWLDEAICTHDAVPVCTAALVRLPPVIVARVLAHHGKLTEEMYHHVVSMRIERMSIADFAVLSCFTSLATKHHEQLVRSGLEAHTFDGGFHVLDEPRYACAASYLMSRPLNTPRYAYRFGQTVSFKVNFKGTGPVNFHLDVHTYMDAKFGFAMTHDSGSTFTTFSVRDGVDVVLNTWRAPNNLFHPYHRPKLYVCLVQERYAYLTPVLPASREHEASAMGFPCEQHHRASPFVRAAPLTMSST